MDAVPEQARGGSRRVIFCTYPSVYSDVVLEELLRSDEIDVAGVVVSSRVLNKKYNHFYASLRQIRLSGLCYAAYLFLVTDLYRVLSWGLGKDTLRECLKKLDIPVLETQDINDAEGQAFISGLQANIMLSAHFNQLVGKKILNLNNLSCLNIHPSLLPDYKGVDPAFYAMLRGENTTGVTVHFQDVEFDTGRILEQRRLEIVEDDSLLDLNLKLFRLGAVSAVGQILGLTAETKGEPQTKGGQYDSWPKVGDVRRFRRKRRLFSWRGVAGVLKPGLFR